MYEISGYSKGHWDCDFPNGPVVKLLSIYNHIQYTNSSGEVSRGFKMKDKK
jgi:hypothetical protein